MNNRDIVADWKRWHRELSDALGCEFLTRQVTLEKAKQLRDRLEQAERQRDEARQQAETWAQEARTQRGTVREIYQLCTGATGEPGDWNGAEPVRTLIRQRDEARGLLRECRERIGPVDLDSSTRTGILIDKIDAHLRDTGK